MIQFLQAAKDSLQTAKDSLNVAKEVVTAIETGHADQIIEKLIDLCISAGKNILIAIIVYFVGRFLISLLQRVMTNMMERRKVEISVQTFLKSMASILLNTLLIVSIVGALGVNTTSFAALIASAGVAIGMALSGNLQNFAGGLIILVFKPYKVGDWIEAQGVSGSVTAIQIMHTIVTTADNKVVYIPNGAMSSGEDIDKVKSIVNGLLQKDSRILKEPAPVIALHALDASSVNVTIRVWVANKDYWDVYFDMNKNIYDEFNKQGVDFPFPQLTIHQS